MTIIANNSNFHYSITQNDEKKIVPQARHFRKQENCKPRKYFYVPLVPLRTWDNERSHLFFMSSTRINLTEKQKTACKKSGILCVFCEAVPTCLCQLVRRKKGDNLRLFAGVLRLRRIVFVPNKRFSLSSRHTHPTPSPADGPRRLPVDERRRRLRAYPGFCFH